MCRTLGLTARDYPLNHDEGGRRSLRRALRQRMFDDFAQANRSAGMEGVKPAAALAFTPSRPVTDPFDTVEFDARCAYAANTAATMSFGRSRRP